MKKNEYGFVEDPRYKQCNREALYGVGLGILNLVIWFVFGYGLGSKPVESYTYILGFPAWFFFSCILNAIFIIMMTFFVVDKKMVDMPLERMDEVQAEEYVKNLTNDLNNSSDSINSRHEHNRKNGGAK